MTLQIVYQFRTKSHLMEPFPPFISYNYIYPPSQAFCLNQLPFSQTPAFDHRNQVLTTSYKHETSLSQIKTKYDELLREKNALQLKLEKALLVIERTRHSHTPKRKIIRRKQDELEREHCCCYDNCKKEYASVLALNLHIKTKHRGGTKKQRDDLAKQVVLAEIKGTQSPKLGINLPEGYIQKFKRQFSSSVATGKIEQDL